MAQKANIQKKVTGIEFLQEGGAISRKLKIKQQNIALKNEFLNSLFRSLSPTKHTTDSRADLETEFLVSIFLCLSPEDQAGIFGIIDKLLYKIKIAQAASLRRSRTKSSASCVR